MLLVLFVAGCLVAGPFFTRGEVDLEIKAHGRESIQIFWAGGDGRYAEKKSDKAEVSPSRSRASIEVGSLLLIDRIRIDPAKKATEVVIQSIEITQFGCSTTIYDSQRGWPEILNAHDVMIRNGDNGLLHVTSLGNDPFFEFETERTFSMISFVRDWSRYLGSVTESQMNLLGLTWSGLLLLSIDMACVLLFGILFARVMGLHSANWTLNCLAVMVAGLGLVVLSVILTGALYLLKTSSLLMCHAAAVAGLLSILKKRTDRSLAGCLADTAAYVRFKIVGPVVTTLLPQEITGKSCLRSLLLFIVIGLLVYYLIPAALTLPLNFDSHDYRLSRIGYWLQEGHIWQFETNDIRQVIMPINSEAVMLWLTSFFPTGYPLVHLSSYTGGILSCVAVYGFAQFLGMSLSWRLCSVLFWLGIPNSAVQMLTSQTDLFTTGCLVAGLYFLHHALQGGRVQEYLLAGAAIGLAVGAKSTVFLWGPGLLLYCVFLLFYFRREMRIPALLRGGGTAVLMIILLGGFTYGQNLMRYETPLGSKPAVKAIKHQKAQLVRQDDGKKLEVEKGTLYLLKLKAMTWQLFEPSSNLSIIRPASDTLFESLEDNILDFNEHFKSPFVGMFKRAAAWFRVTRMSEDYLSFGMLTFLVFVCGGAVAAVTGGMRGGATSRYVLCMFLAVVLYLLFFPLVAGWTAHRYRYAVLVTPFIALVGTYGLYRLAHFKALMSPIRLLAILVIFYQVSMSAAIASNTQSHGWTSLTELEKVNSYVFYWRDMEKLVDNGLHDGDRVGIYLSKGSWKSLFFRNRKNVTATYIKSDTTLVVDDTFCKKRGLDVLITKRLSGLDLKTRVEMVQSGQGTHQALRPVGDGKAAAPWILDDTGGRANFRRASGVLHVGNYHDDGLVINVCNMSTGTRNIMIESGSEVKHMVSEPGGACTDMRLAVGVSDTVKWTIDGPDHESMARFAPDYIGVRFAFPRDKR